MGVARILTRAAAALLPVLTAASVAPPPPPPEADWRRTDLFFEQGAYAEGRLWLLDLDGRLYSLAEGEPLVSPERIGEPLLALCASAGRLFAVGGPREGARRWTIRRREGRSWPVIATVAARGETVIAFSCADGRLLLLSSRRIIEASAPGMPAAPLSDRLFGLPATTIFLDAPAGTYIGISVGEWGGGLHRIDPRTGRMTTIESNLSRSLCGGPLNTECDPVNGLLAAPGRPDCILATVGSLYGMRGRIVRVCGDRIERLYLRPYPMRGYPNEIAEDGEPNTTVPFFELAAFGDGGAIALGLDGVYRLLRSGAVRRDPPPRFRRLGGVLVSFDDPDFVLVARGIDLPTVPDYPLMLVPR